MIGPATQRLRRYFGWTLVVGGCAAPLLIPFVLTGPLPATVKAMLSAALAFGLPEILIAAAAGILGWAEIKRVFGKVTGALESAWRRFLSIWR